MTAPSASTVTGLGMAHRVTKEKMRNMVRVKTLWRLGDLSWLLGRSGLWWARRMATLPRDPRCIAIEHIVSTRVWGTKREETREGDG
jgi:hypothetical protein